MILRSKAVAACQQVDAKRNRTRSSASAKSKDMATSQNVAAEQRVVIAYCPGDLIVSIE